MDHRIWCAERGRCGAAWLGVAGSVLLALATIASACGDDGNEGEPTPRTAITNTVTQAAATTETPTRAETTTATPEPDQLYPTGYRTGEAAMDDLLAILEKGDGEALAAKVELRELPCTTAPTGILGDPPCEDNEEAGTLVEVMIWGNCEPMYIREPLTSESVESFGQTSYRLAFAYDNGAALGVVVGTGEVDGYATVSLSYAGGVIGVSTNCGGELSIPSGDDVDFVVPPR